MKGMSYDLVGEYINDGGFTQRWKLEEQLFSLGLSGAQAEVFFGRDLADLEESWSSWEAVHVEHDVEAETLSLTGPRAPLRDVAKWTRENKGLK